MKATESVKNYAASLRMYTNYTVREIKKICKTIGPRPAGSEKEFEAQKHIAEEMKTCADTVEIEDDEETEENEKERLENIELEAKFVANRIKQLIDNKFQIYDAKKQEKRDIKYACFPCRSKF